MRLGFDAKRAVRNFTGLGNYSRFIIDALASAAEDSLYLYSSRFPPAAVPFPDNARFRHPGPRRWGSYWRTRGILADLRRDRIDVFHGLSNELPVGIKGSGIRSVVTIHDLIFLRFPHYYPWFDRTVYRLKFQYACRNADRIIAISEQTRKDIIAFFGIPGERIDVVYQDCSDLFKSRYDDAAKLAVRKKYRLPEQFLLNVGTIEDRKNLLLIVQALKKLPAEISLVVVGKETSYAGTVRQYIEEHRLTGRVIFLKNVAYTDLPLIYQQSSVFVYPSRFEGFGIPVLEALHSGVPVIAATGSCLEEAGGPGSLYVSPDDPSGLAAAISAVWSDEARRAGMIASGKEHVLQFSKERIAQRLTKIYHQVLNHA
ncbi:MAG TPA: glycosyltransferase family 1 protein [Sphingobacteriaceae bacterium]